MVTKAQVEKARKELKDLIVLVFDDIPNSQQVTQFMSEGFEGMKALADIGIPTAGERLAVAANLSTGLANDIVQELLPLPEG